MKEANSIKNIIENYQMGFYSVQFLVELIHEHCQTYPNLCKIQEMGNTITLLELGKCYKIDLSAKIETL